MSAWIRSVTGRAYHFVPIAQNTERPRPKRQVVGENPTGDTTRVWFNSRMRPCQGRDDGATPFTRSNFRGRSSSAERSFDMREAKRAALFAPTIFPRTPSCRPSQRILCSGTVENAFGLKHKLELPFQVHIPEDLIQGFVANHFVVF